MERQHIAEINDLKQRINSAESNLSELVQSKELIEKQLNEEKQVLQGDKIRLERQLNSIRDGRVTEQREQVRLETLRDQQELIDNLKEQLQEVQICF